MCEREQCLSLGHESNVAGLLWVLLDVVLEVGARQLYCDVIVSSMVQGCLYRWEREGEGRGGEGRR